MNLEELWQLFPIFLAEHQPCWKEWYLEEEILLNAALSSTERISHIESTTYSVVAEAILKLKGSEFLPW